MSWLRPARTVSSPDGTDWEIYVTRGRAAAWKPVEYDSPSEWGSGLGAVGTGVGALALLGAILELPLFLLFQVLLPALRFLVEAPVSAVRGHASRARTVEAITRWPHPERHAWSTTADHVDRVVEQIADGLAAGEVARPLGATYLGERDGF